MILDQIEMLLQIDQNGTWTAGVQHKTVHSSFSSEPSKQNWAKSDHISTFITEWNLWLNFSTDDKMPPSSIQYTKQRWLLTIAGLFLYVADTCSDVGLALKYYQEKHFVWTGLTLVFVLAGVLVTQIFSYVWYRDDMNGPLGITEGGPNISGTSTGRLAVLHLFGMGIFTRYDCENLKVHFHKYTKLQT